jgi:hypothetical protein
VSVVIAVPAEVAESLLNDDLAGRPLKRRGEPTVIAATLEVVGLAANLVTVVVAVPQVRDMIRRTIRWALRRPEVKQEAEQVVLTIRFPSGIAKTIPLNADSAQIEVLAKEIEAESEAKKSGG